MRGVYVVDSPKPNAFATGRSPKHAAIAVTVGIRKLLNERELRGVLAHELAHVSNRDTLISAVAATMASAISMIGWVGLWFGGSRRGGNGRTMSLPGASSLRTTRGSRCLILAAVGPGPDGSGFMHAMTAPGLD